MSLYFYRLGKAYVYFVMLMRSQASGCSRHLLPSILGLCTMVPCLNIASSERPIVSKVASPYPSFPLTINLYYPVLYHLWHLTNLWDDLFSLFAYCLFLTLDYKVPWEQRCVCSVLIPLDIQVSAEHMVIQFLSDESMNSFIKDYRKVSYLR